MNIDKRGTHPNTHPVWRKSTIATLPKLTTAKSFSVRANGRLEHIYVVTGVYDAADTVVLTVLDDNGVTLYTSASLAESTTHKLDVSVLVAGQLTLTLTASAQQDDADVINTIHLYGV